MAGLAPLEWLLFEILLSTSVQNTMAPKNLTSAFPSVPSPIYFRSGRQTFPENLVQLCTRPVELSDYLQYLAAFRSSDRNQALRSRVDDLASVIRGPIL